MSVLRFVERAPRSTGIFCFGAIFAIMIANACIRVALETTDTALYGCRDTNQRSIYRSTISHMVMVCNSVLRVIIDFDRYRYEDKRI